MYLPESRRLGAEGEGFVHALKTLNGGRITIAARGVGIAQAALDAALSYSSEREQFDQPIGEFQAIQHKLADMHTQTEAARQLTYKSAWSVDNKSDSLTMLASMAKEFASRVAVEVADEAVQIHGGAGYVNDFDVERFYRDAKITQIYEGTTEIQKNLIARELLGKGMT
jgi:alkylation response protein AidB-like acyl-CoA dehydrogenase